MRVKRMGLLCSIVLVLSSLFLSGCLGPDTIDISALSEEHRTLFIEVAKITDVVPVLHSSPQIWQIKYNPAIPYSGQTSFYDLGAFQSTCLIEINTKWMSSCGPSLKTAKFKRVIYHELQHCRGEKHSEDPTSLMYYKILCETLN